MEEKEIKGILKSKFQLEKGTYLPEGWKTVLNLFFNEIDYFSHPKNLSTENDKEIAVKQIGTVELDDRKQLAIITVEVADSISIDRNRQGLREIAAKHIDQNIIHGSLAFFYNKNQANYRFSFIAKEASIDIETGKLIQGETKPKRYTYLLGLNEACTTPAKRMLVLADKKGVVTINQLKEVFSVEALNKDFFKSYKAHYEKFWKYLADEVNTYRAKLIDAEKDDEVKQEKHIRDFAKKLLGRIVFLHFLQKKGWMGCSPKTKDWIDGEPRFMQQLFAHCPDKEHFHSNFLTKLFFNTLNTKRNGDLAPEGLVHNSEFVIHKCKIPYLNGGLFEPDKNQATLNIDFPANYFKELLEFFEQYNFTIDENSPDDHEVGIDPEMLGHIFENLLEDNKDKGAFYTPKEIVQYMCKESLIQYLLNTFQEQKDIEQFIRFHTVSSILAEKENAILLNKKLDDIKVCDPAIGSGAFPIGMLQEIFEAKRFIYPHLKTNKDFKPTEVKKNIIQNSIYGVDLENGAVDIARLRFWLSLVVDELNPHTLPNLDYKIMQGNSLLEKFEGIDLSQMGKINSDVTIATPKTDLYGNLNEDQMKITFLQSDKIPNIQELINPFFTIDISEQKNKIREDINKLVLQHIEYNIKLRENQLDFWIKETGNPDDLSKKAKKKYDGYKSNLTKLQDAKIQLKNIQETDERPYFLWHLYFMDVFDPPTGSGGGFDVMIGNPPYIQLQKMGKETDILQEAGFETFARTGDIYCLFYEKGIDLLKKGGTLTYITSNKWLRTDYGKNLRKFFSKQNPLLVIDLGANVFHSATVDTNILILEKNSFSKKLKGISIQNHLDLNSSKVESALPIDIEDDTIWNVLSEQDYSLKEQLEKKGKPLYRWNIQINRGVLSGLTEAYLLSEAKANEFLELDIKNKEVIFPTLRGKDLDMYKIKFKNYYLLNIHNGVRETGRLKINIENYPIIKSYLDSFGTRLTNRADQGDTPYNLRNCAFLKEFYKPKIIYQEIVQQPSFAFDKDGEFFCLDTARIITGEKLLFLLTVLNSNLFFYSVKYFYGGGGLGNTGIRMKHTFIDKFPVPEIKITKPYETIAEYLIYLNDPKQESVLEKASNEAISQVFEDLVNMMVYELYFKEEMNAKEIDVLQFVTEKAFPDINQAEDKKSVIQKVYYELQQKDNPIRNRVLVASSRSETIARINAATSKLVSI